MEERIRNDTDDVLTLSLRASSHGEKKRPTENANYRDAIKSSFPVQSPKGAEPLRSLTPRPGTPYRALVPHPYRTQLPGP